MDGQLPGKPLKASSFDINKADHLRAEGYHGYFSTLVFHLSERSCILYAYIPLPLYVFQKGTSYLDEPPSATSCQCFRWVIIDTPSASACCCSAAMVSLLTPLSRYPHEGGSVQLKPCFGDFQIYPDRAEFTANGMGKLYKDKFANLWSPERNDDPSR